MLKKNMYSVNFFSLSKVKIRIFLALIVILFGNELYWLLAEENLSLANLPQLIHTGLFYLIISFVVAAVLEFVYFKVKR